MNTKVQLAEKNGVWLDFSTCEYRQMFRLQEELRGRRQRGEIGDVILMLEHSPCITVGSSGGYHHLLAGSELLKRNNISVHDTSRGGDITYHGPGQLVCYPILALEGTERDLHDYARKMEEVMVRTLLSFGIVAGRKSKYPGVWVGNAKIGAMGISVRKWVTMHGISLNVCPDLNHFSFIVPCGIATNGVTSMEKVLKRDVDIDAVRGEMRNQFSEVFQITLHSGRLEQFITDTTFEEAYFETT